MDSPPSCSVTLSEILVLSEDSGLLLTSDHSGSLDVVSSCSDQSSHCYYTMEVINKFNHDQNFLLPLKDTHPIVIMLYINILGSVFSQRNISHIIFDIFNIK